MKNNETVGRQTPANSKRACLCQDGKTYSRKCCNGTLRAQGIGRITSISAFSDGFSNGFLN